MLIMMKDLMSLMDSTKRIIIIIIIVTTTASITASIITAIAITKFIINFSNLLFLSYFASFASRFFTTYTLHKRMVNYLRKHKLLRQSVRIYRI
jgi:hypothetical protein